MRVEREDTAPYPGSHCHRNAFYGGEKHNNIGKLRSVVNSGKKWLSLFEQL